MVSATEVPFLDLAVGLRDIRPELDAAIGAVADRSQFVLGNEVQEFEEEFARYCGALHCVGVGSGTDALHLALRACGVGADDEVITVSLSFVASASAISMTGAVPVFVDVDSITCTMDPARLRQAITSKTKAVVPVHLYGQCADMDPILEIADEFGLTVIEDASHAHGAMYKGSRAGSMGHLGCFSFYPTKNLGAWGDAGAVVTSDESLAGELISLRTYGQVRKYVYNDLGFNSRLDEIQAAVLRVKLHYLDEWNRLRSQAADYYTAHLDQRIATPLVGPDRDHVFHLFVIRSNTRNDLQEHLHQQRVGTGIHYPIPIHLQEAYTRLPCRHGDLSVTEHVAATILSLPLFPGISEEQLGRVVEVINNYVARA